MRLVDSDNATVPAGLVVLRKMDTTIIILDMIGRQADWPSLVAEASRIGSKEHMSAVRAWVTEAIPHFEGADVCHNDYALYDTIPGSNAPPNT